ncbi:OmpA-OmpF porin, OOP family [Paracoccus isoporae]|uniref:OmpA-OmpF porin, OOP family n=1 Tax=Paracoccus isoporae TaxID=591205 RepID=A0A1G7EL72_9RHOB|nr:OmpA family protein [Paracoccus isoporae]SDE64166.1 OmpA-OmpF porin, OOP family [Paracoccus isoporae]
MDEQRNFSVTETPRRGRAYLVLSLLALATAGAASWDAATRIADAMETRTRQQIRSVLASEGQGWARVRTDGLVVRLSGTAPDEVARFRALTAASGVVDDHRIRDEMTVAVRDMLEPPDFSLELMRQGRTLSLIGLVPARTDREALARKLVSDGAEITDLTSTAAFPPPEDWGSALDFAVAAAGIIDQGTISVAPSRVRINANAASPEDKLRLEGALISAAPPGLSVSTEIAAPLPVIAPYVLRLTRSGPDLRLEECAAPDAASRDAILSAVAALRAPGDGDVPAAASCALGIGAPDGWTDSVTSVIAALGRMGDGTVEMTDETVEIVLPATATPELAETETAALSAALPAGYTLRLTRAEADPADGPPRFTATIGADGPAEIAGVVPDETMRQTVQSLARAQLGPVEGELKLNPALRDGWALRVLAGLDAMGALDLGRVTVSADQIMLSGISGDRQASEKALAALSARLGEGAAYAMSIAYDPLRDPQITRPDGTVCVDRLNAIMLQSEIGFEPGGARIAGDIDPVIEEIRPVLEDCADYSIELAGHTDAQGGDASNMALSLDRAQAVLGALRDAGLPVANLTARGYGETRPIAENDTEEGREANRRIELTLSSPDPVRAPLPLAPIRTGLTPSADAAAAALQAARPASEVVSPAPLPLVPELAGAGLLEIAPVIEPPAVVQQATPDTPRPPDRPEDPQNAANAAEEAP